MSDALNLMGAAFKKQLGALFNTVRPSPDLFLSALS